MVHSELHKVIHINSCIRQHNKGEIVMTIQKTELQQFLKPVAPNAETLSKKTAIDNLTVNTTMPTTLLAHLPAVHINRDFKRRVAKQTPNFLKDLIGQKVFTVFNVTEELNFDFHGEQITVEPGRYIADGNTRLEAHRQGKIELPTNVVCLTIHIDDAEDYKQEYFAIDNSAATENSSDLIRGAIGFLDMNLDSTVGKGGNFASALKNAYPNDRTDSTIDKIAFFKSELELLDKCNIFNPSESDLKHQHFYGAMLMAAKLYATPPSSANKFQDVLKQLGRLESMDLNLSGNKWNGITALMFQCSNPEKKEWIPIECQGKTNYASIEPSYDFYLYCIELAMTDKLINKARGFKKANWEGYYNKTLELIK